MDDCYCVANKITEQKAIKILIEKWAGLSFKNGPPERAYKVNKIR